MTVLGDFGLLVSLPVPSLLFSLARSLTALLICLVLILLIGVSVYMIEQ